MKRTVLTTTVIVMKRANMCTGALTLLCRQRIVYHLVLLVLCRLQESSSTYNSLNGCSEYPKVCSEEKDSHNNCTITPNDQICHYSKNDSLLQSDFFSLFGKPEDIPESPNNFSVTVNYLYVEDVCMPTLKFSWKKPTDEKSAKWLTGFALNVSFVYNNNKRQTVRLFSVENELSNDAIFEYDCFTAVPGVSYQATIFSLPTNLQNIVTRTVSVDCSTPSDQRSTSYDWRAEIDASVLSNGSISVYFMPAPINFNFSIYHVWLSPMSTDESATCRTKSTLSTLRGLCPEQGQLVLIPTDPDVHKEFTVCIQPYKCPKCTRTPFNVRPFVAEAESPSMPIGSVTTVSSLNPDGAFLVEAIGIAAGLLFVVLLTSFWIYRIRRQRYKEGVNPIKKYVFLLYGNDVRRHFVHAIDRLSAFLQLCNNYEVISSDDCSRIDVLEQTISLADSVLIISSTDAAYRHTASAERRDVELDSESATDTSDIFDSAVKLIRRNHQIEGSYMKFCQIIILPCCQDGCTVIEGLPDLKVKKTYQLMEFVKEIWRNKQTLPNNMDSKEFRKGYELFKELELVADNINCCSEQCMPCRMKACQHIYERSVCKQDSNDSGVTVDYSSSSFQAEAVLPQYFCVGRRDTQSHTANSQFRFMRRSADSINCLPLEIRPRHDNSLQSSIDPHCKLAQYNQTKIDLHFIHKSCSSFSSSAISITSFYSKFGKLNDEFDRDLKADGGIDDECDTHYH